MGRRGNSSLKVSSLPRTRTVFRDHADAIERQLATLTEESPE